eukprot:3699977-Amphidinium_carterae.1
MVDGAKLQSSPVRCKPEYFFMEFCCDKDSHLCSTLIASDPRVRTFRVTEEMDGDDVDTLYLALDAIDEAHKDGLPIFVWGNIPRRNSEKVHSMFFGV